MGACPFRGDLIKGYVCILYVVILRILGTDAVAA